MKYVVERTQAYTFIVEANSEEEAENIATEQALDTAHETFVVNVSTYPLHQSTYFKG